MIGSRVTIGPGATVHAATIEDCVVIGMGATIMDGAKVRIYLLLCGGEQAVASMFTASWCNGSTSHSAAAVLPVLLQALLQAL